ncbi:unnamed protein product, partial [Phaeothamnion confervicola]
DSVHAHLVRERREGTIDDYYRVERRIGHGSMGTVAEVLNKQTGHHLALKTIQLARISDQMIDEMRNEIEILKRLDHPNIIKAIETFESRRRVYLVMELCSGGDLTKRGPYSEGRAAATVLKMVSAVAYMHSRGVCHRDLKLENVLYSSEAPDAELKLIDFGLSKIYLKNQRLHGVVGTLYSMAPEVFSGSYDSKCDMWSVGVLAYILLCGRMPFDCSSKNTLVEDIQRGVVSFQGPHWSGISEPAKAFVRSLIVRDPHKRATAAQALHDPWLNKVGGADVTVRGSRHLSHDDHEGLLISFRRYAGYSKLKRAALMVVAHRSEPGELRRLREIFMRYDVEHTGTITVRDFKTVLLQEGFQELEIETVYQELDEDNDGEIQYTEFLAASLETMGQMEEERLLDAFDQMDAEGSGVITRQNVLDFCGREDRGHYDVDAVLAEADFKHLGSGIDLEEFLRLMRQ